MEGGESDNACYRVPADTADNRFTDDTTLPQGMEFEDVGYTGNKRAEWKNQIPWKIILPPKKDTVREKMNTKASGFTFKH